MKPHVSLTVLVLLAAAVAVTPASAQTSHLSGGPETLLSAPPEFAPAEGGQGAGALVPTSDGWIAVWVDDLELYPSAVRKRILATRLTPDGAAIDTTGVRVAERASYLYFTAVASPEGARIFWVYPAVAGFELETATVSLDGEVSAPVVVGTFPGEFTSSGLAVAASGSRFAVHFYDHVMIVDGERLVRRIDLGGGGDLASIVAAGSHFVVVWSASGQILMRQTIDLDGNASPPAGGLGVASPGRLHGLASDGTKALLTWGDQGGTHMAIVDPATNAHVETALVPSAAWSSPRAVWAGSSYLVTWYSPANDGLLGIRVSSSGALLDAAPSHVFDGDAGYYFMAARGPAVMLLSQTGNCIRYYCQTEVHTHLLGAASAEGHLVSAAARQQAQPAAASDGSAFLALWREGTSGVFVAETSDRQRTAAAPLQLSSDWGSGTATSGSGAGYVAGWIAQRSARYYIEAATLTRVDGRLTPRHALSIDAGTEGPHQIAVGSAPDMHLVVWQHATDYYAVRVDPAGNALDGVPIRLWIGEPVWSPPVVAFDGVDFLVGGFAQQGDGLTYALKTQRISRSGVVTSDRTWFSVAASVVSGYAFACGPGACMLAWSERIEPYALAGRTMGQRFRPGGELLDASPVPLSYAEGEHVLLDCLWDGARFIVVVRLNGTIAARTVPPAGTPPVAPLDVVASNEDYSAGPSTACNREGRCIAVEARRVDTPALGRTYRLYKSHFGEARHRGARP